MPDRRRNVRRWIVGAASLLFSIPAWGAGFVPGTRVSLEPPVGFAPASQFPGFAREELGASIMVNEVPGPVSEVRAGLTAEGLASQGVTLLDSRSTTVDGHEALLAHASQTAAGTSFEKWMLVFGDAQRTVLLVGTFPEAEAETLREPIRVALLSARWSPATELDPFEGLPFRITESQRLRIANRMSNVLLLTKAGASGPVSPEDPLLVVGASISEVDLSDLEGFSRQRVAQTAQVEGVSNVAGRPTTVNALPAYELTCDARDARSGKPIRLYQLIVAKERSYFMAQGLVGAAAADEFLPEFRQVGHSLRSAP